MKDDFTRKTLFKSQVKKLGLALFMMSVLVACSSGNVKEDYVEALKKTETLDTATYTVQTDVKTASEEGESTNSDVTLDFERGVMQIDQTYASMGESYTNTIVINNDDKKVYFAADAMFDIGDEMLTESVEGKLIDMSSSYGEFLFTESLSLTPMISQHVIEGVDDADFKSSDDVVSYTLTDVDASKLTNKLIYSDLFYFIEEIVIEEVVVDTTLANGEITKEVITLKGKLFGEESTITMTSEIKETNGDVDITIDEDNIISEDEFTEMMDAFYE